MIINQIAAGGGGGVDNILVLPNEYLLKLYYSDLPDYSEAIITNCKVYHPHDYNFPLGSFVRDVYLNPYPKPLVFGYIEGSEVVVPLSDEKELILTKEYNPIYDQPPNTIILGDYTGYNIEGHFCVRMLIYSFEDLELSEEFTLEKYKWTQIFIDEETGEFVRIHHKYDPKNNLREPLDANSRFPELSQNEHNAISDVISVVPYFEDAKNVRFIKLNGKWQQIGEILPQYGITEE